MAKRGKDFLNRRADKEVIDKCSYELACQAIFKEFGNCYISVAIHCCLPYWVLHDIFGEILYTILIHFLFFETRRPNDMTREELKEYFQNDWHQAANDDII